MFTKRQSCKIYQLSNRKIFIIPMHSEIAKGILKSILEQADIELEEFLKNL